MSEEFENWACAALDQLGLPDGSIIIQYLQPLDNQKEVREYLNSMLNTNKPQHCKFIEEFLERQALSKVDKRFYRKGDADEIFNVSQGKKKNKEKGQTNGNDSTKNKKKESSIDKELSKDTKSPRISPVGFENNLGQSKKKGGKDSGNKQSSPPPPPAAAVAATTVSAKKKTKFVNLYSGDGSNRDIVMLSGRNMCDCLASKHKLINNCLACGRIVCEQEGSGPCMFCDNMVLTKDEEMGVVTTTLKPNNKSQNKANKKASVKDVAADIKKAVQHKDMLLEYDRTSEKRTRVFDDESDYFDSNSRWLSKENREILQAKEKDLKEKKYDRSRNMVTVDLLGRKIIVDDTNDAGVYDPDDPIVKAILEHQPDDIFSSADRSDDRLFTLSKRPLYVESSTSSNNNCDVDRPLKFPMGAGNSMHRLQDRELQEMADQGKCLSMHQPWASLLIAGIKEHEGRVWYSSHRGRLWIASASKVATVEEIQAVEDQYTARAGEESEALVFPQHYPPGCLLGHVDVRDVLPQEEYRTLYPSVESDSPYVFVCSNPKEMVFKFPIKGEHKIFMLDSKIHAAAKKALK